MSSKPAILILGAGANVGVSVAKHFKSQGWRVVGVSRNPTEAMKASVDLALAADFEQPSTLQAVFDRTIAEVGVPSVVVHNAYGMQFSSASNPVSLSPAAVQAGLAVSTLSAYEAARLSIAAWSDATFPVAAGAPATPAFIYTGNMMNTQLFPLATVLGMAKNAAAYMLEVSATAYRGKFRFYYADERTAEGESVMQAIDGDLHGVEYWDLAHGKAEREKGLELGAGNGQGEWNWTFVKGKGYVKNAGFHNREFRGMSVPGFE